MRLGVGDPKHGVYAFRELQIPGFGHEHTLGPNDLVIRAKSNVPVPIYPQPLKASSVIGWLEVPTQARAAGTDWYRVTMSDGLFGWTSKSDVVRADVAVISSTAKYTSITRPMRIRIRDEATLTICTQATETVVGEVSSEDPIRDLRVYVNGKKVFFKSAKQALSRNLMRFSVQVPLELGLNRVDFVARSEKVPSQRHTVIIDRRRLNEWLDGLRNHPRISRGFRRFWGTRLKKPPLGNRTRVVVYSHRVPFLAWSCPRARRARKTANLQVAATDLECLVIPPWLNFVLWEFVCHGVDQSSLARHDNASGRSRLYWRMVLLCGRRTKPRI